eukprot:TRINITY_DN15418_c0_g1_i1.p1 TRINITY_DN15418_c0_g1~~TRINITY_DN15418_c0_g1_i1.p1  ORF type:complete len:623 (-),score=123.49 TRINITY_DN15418_c0_g1_i1:18-1886(-)
METGEDEKFVEHPFSFSGGTSILEEIDKAYKHKDVYVRIGVARRLPEIVEEIQLKAARDHILPIIDALVCDDSPEVRETMMEQALSLCAVFASLGSQGLEIVSDYLLGAVISRLSDRHEKTKQLAIQSLSSLCGLIERKTVVANTIPTIEKLANNKSNPKIRAAAIHLLNELAFLLEKDLTLSFSLPLLKALATDPSYVVRCAVPGNLSKMCQVLGEKDAAKLVLPVFTFLANDQIWTVRRAVARGLVAMSDAVDQESRKQLVPVFLDLAEDKIRWVRNEARYESGSFIATFSRKEVVAVILHYYASTASDNPEEDVCVDPELPFKFAFNFPAVLLTTGADGWSTLSAAYEKLALHPNWEVRSSFSHSMHHVAEIVGPEITKTALLPIVKEYCNDLDEVKSGILEEFAQLLRKLDGPTLLSNEWILNFIVDLGFQQSRMYWRFREMIALQISDFASMYPKDIVLNYLVPLGKILLTDKVAVVRRTMSNEAGRFIRVLKSIFGNADQYTDFCASMARATGKETTTAPAGWHCRTTFAIMCPEIFKYLSREKWASQFQPELINLLNDKVVNIRYNAGKSLLAVNKTLKDPAISQLVFNKLKSERDRDIQALLKQQHSQLTPRKP